MTRKLLLVVASGAVLVASMGLSSTAVAKIDPECTPFSNAVGIFKFKIKTPNSSTAFDASSISGGALACGSDIDFNKAGVDTLYREIAVEVANGVVITDPYAAGVPIGSYAGKAKMNELTALTVLPARFDKGVNEDLTLAPRGTGKCPGTEVVCYFGDGGVIQESEFWAELDPVTGKYTLKIGEINFLLPGITGITKIWMSLCQNFGSTGNSCGSDSDPVVQFNGAASDSGTALGSLLGGSSSTTRGCTNGNGIYTASGLLRNGTAVPGVDTCVPWRLAL